MAHVSPMPRKPSCAVYFLSESLNGQNSQTLLMGQVEDKT